MSATVIRSFGPKDLLQLREIFFESSSRKTFESESAREAFFHKYLGHYLGRYPDLARVALINGEVMGYIVASPETNQEDLFLLQPHLIMFKNYFAQFPAHLHINCHQDARGLGLGSLLINSTLNILAKGNINGVHIMTSPESKNTSFYRKLGFTFETVEEFHGSAILFMGREISRNSF